MSMSGAWRNCPEFGIRSSGTADSLVNTDSNCLLRSVALSFGSVMRVPLSLSGAMPLFSVLRCLMNVQNLFFPSYGFSSPIGLMMSSMYPQYADLTSFWILCFSSRNYGSVFLEPVFFFFVNSLSLFLISLLMSFEIHGKLSFGFQRR